MVSLRTDTPTSDEAWMGVALALAARGLGRVAPNPAVGCVIVKDGIVVGRGWTQPGGRPHAETEALKQAGEQAKGATAYVSLEPCSHHGKTPPCADALIAAGIVRCIVAIEDPDDRVDGEGIKALEATGIVVEVGVLAGRAADLNSGFISRFHKGRPMVTLKLATSADHKVAAAPGEMTWITGQPARRYGHLLRAQHDAILTGIGTVLADDPALTCRLPGMEDRSPVRILVDTHLRLPPESQLISTAWETPTWIFASEAALAGGRGPYEEAGVWLFDTPLDNAGRLDLEDVLSSLAAEGMTRLMLECGPGLATAFLRGNLVDRIAWFRAPHDLGEGAVDALDRMDLVSAIENNGFDHIETLTLGEDVLETYSRNSY